MITKAPLRLILCLLGVGTANQVLAQMSAGDAFVAGQQFSAGKSAAAAAQITGGRGAEVVPNYSATSPEAGYYAGGQGQLGGFGVQKMATCASGPQGADAYQQQECEAVNFLAKNPQVRPQFSVQKTDPIITQGAAINKGPDSILSQYGYNTSGGTYTACSTANVTTPAQYADQSCTSMASMSTQQCTYGRTVNIDSDANFQCERTVTALSNAARSTTVTTPQCTTGRTVNIDSDSNFQCSETVNAYENLSCKITMEATVSGTSGSDARVVVANYGSAYLYVGGGVSGVWLHSASGAESPISSGTHSGASFGLDSPGNTYKIDVTHNNCAGGLCTGSATLSVWRQFNSTWLGLSQMNWQQYSQSQSLCSMSNSFGVGAGYRGGGCTISSTTCPSSNQATISYSCNNGYQSFSGTRTLSTNTSTTIETTTIPEVSCETTGYDQWGTPVSTCYVTSYYSYDCNGSTWITYNGNGSFSYSTSGRAGGSCGESATHTTTFSYPLQVQKVTINKNNGCIGLEERSR